MIIGGPGISASSLLWVCICYTQLLSCISNLSLHVGNFLATQLKKALLSASKHKSALEELNAALGKSTVGPWEKLYLDYYNGKTNVNIFQEANDGNSFFP